MLTKPTTFPRAGSRPGRTAQTQKDTEKAKGSRPELPNEMELGKAALDQGCCRETAGQETPMARPREKRYRSALAVEGSGERTTACHLCLRSLWAENGFYFSNHWKKSKESCTLFEIEVLEFINKILVEYSPSHAFPYCLWLLHATKVELRG